jgi:hypothetical protein
MTPVAPALILHLTKASSDLLSKARNTGTHAFKNQPYFRKTNNTIKTNI